jgi:hypothetical protein
MTWRALLCLLPLAALAIEAGSGARLARVRRVYVEPLTGGQAGTQMRDMLIAALENSGLYTITEDPAQADAILRGSADDQVYTESHVSTDSLGVNSRASAGATSADRQSARAGIGAGISQRESSHIQERRHEAVVAVRLVDKDAEVIWSTTQESGGGKFRGALADAADKAARNLIEQTQRVRTAANRK